MVWWRPLTLVKVASPPLRYGAPEEVGMSSARVRHVAQLASSWVAQGMTPAQVVLIARYVAVRQRILDNSGHGRIDSFSRTAWRA